MRPGFVYSFDNVCYGNELAGHVVFLARSSGQSLTCQGALNADEVRRGPNRRLPAVSV